MIYEKRGCAGCADLKSTSEMKQQGLCFPLDINKSKPAGKKSIFTFLLCFQYSGQQSTFLHEVSLTYVPSQLSGCWRGVCTAALQPDKSCFF